MTPATPQSTETPMAWSHFNARTCAPTPLSQNILNFSTGNTKTSSCVSLLRPPLAKFPTIWKWVHALMAIDEICIVSSVLLAHFFPSPIFLFIYLLLPFTCLSPFLCHLILSILCHLILFILLWKQSAFLYCAHLSCFTSVSLHLPSYISLLSSLSTILTFLCLFMLSTFILFSLLSSLNCYFTFYSTFFFLFSVMLSVLLLYYVSFLSFFVHFAFILSFGVLSPLLYSTFSYCYLSLLFNVPVLSSLLLTFIFLFFLFKFPKPYILSSLIHLVNYLAFTFFNLPHVTSHLTPSCPLILIMCSSLSPPHVGVTVIKSHPVIWAPPINTCLFKSLVWPC